ncbi:MAG: Aspartate aminotransferase family protein [Naasia sp.]|nr:Aspartate aminotransferase family protein [Naasia sp.]
MSSEPWNTGRLLEIDHAHVVHPNYPFGKSAEVVLVRGEGIRLFDSEGKSYIDGRSQLNCANLGYGHPRLIEAMKAQLDELQYASIFYQFTHPQVVSAAERIIASAPAGLKHILFTSGGSEAVESALTIARLYWSRVGRAQKTKVLSRYDGYHGATSEASAATGMAMGGFDGMINRPGHVHAPAVNYFRSGRGMQPEEYGRFAAQQLVEIIQAEGPETIAAFIGEPIVGAGGHVPPPPGYWSAVREICDRYDILLILDEVMTGFHRTGPRFASEHWSVAPDILVVGKGINGSYAPCGATIFSETIGHALEGAKLTGFTHTGHPLAMAAVNATLDALELDGIPENVADMSGILMNRLEKEFLPLPRVGAAEGMGLMVTLQLVADKQSQQPLGDEVVQKEVVAGALRRGLIVRARNGRIALCPPLIVSEAEIHEILDILHPLVKNLD